MLFMRIIFDNNAFAYLAQRREWVDTLIKLKHLSKESQIQVIGTCTLLRELSGLALSDVEMYLTTLSQYQELVSGKILMPALDALVKEGQELRPLSFEGSLLDEEKVENFLYNLRDPSLAHELFGETGSLKAEYHSSMERAVQKMFALPEFHAANAFEIGMGYKEWFQRFPSSLQDWFVHLF